MDSAQELLAMTTDLDRLFLGLAWAQPLASGQFEP
jgi:hypothetical protein